MGSEAERRHEKALASEIPKAETAHAKVVTAFRSEVEASASRTNALEMQVADLDNRRSGARVLVLTKAENALVARCQTPQAHYEEILDHRN